MLRITGLIFVGFFPAGLLILGQVIWGGELSYSLLAAGLFLLAIDQARMADLDLQQVMVVKQDSHDKRLDSFWRLAILTIAIELAGFYLASRFLGWGIQLVLLSQLGFNGLATIEIQPSEAEVIRPRPFKDRFPLMVANGMAMGLMGLWMAGIAPVAIVTSLWAIAIAYAAVKIWRLIRPMLA